MPQLLTITCHKMGSFEEIVCNYNFKRKLQCETNFTTFCHCFVCSQSTTKQKNHKNGSTSKFTFEVISWKLISENHFCLLLMIGNQCGNYIRLNNGALFKVLWKSFFSHYECTWTKLNLKKILAWSFRIPLAGSQASKT